MASWVTYAAILALAAQATGSDLPYLPDEYSEIDREMDTARENLVAAQTYICDDLRGDLGSTKPRRSYDKAEKRYAAAEKSAEALLGRKLNVRVWVNSCRNRDPGAKFYRHLRAAERALDSADRLLANGGQA